LKWQLSLLLNNNNSITQSKVNGVKY